MSAPYNTWIKTNLILQDKMKKEFYNSALKEALKIEATSKRYQIFKNKLWLSCSNKKDYKYLGKVLFKKSHQTYEIV